MFLLKIQPHLPVLTSLSPQDLQRALRPGLQAQGSRLLACTLKVRKWIEQKYLGGAVAPALLGSVIGLSQLQLFLCNVLSGTS